MFGSFGQVRMTLGTLAKLFGKWALLTIVAGRRSQLIVDR